MKTRYLTFLFAFHLSAATDTKQPLVLWYTQPAAVWNEAMPIGNGRLGAMVFGGVSTEHFQLNEDTVWAGEKRDRNNPEGAKNLPEVKRLLFAGKPKEAEELADRTMIATPRRMPPYQTLGDLQLRFSNQNAFTDYRRELDLDTAMVRISYQSGDTRYTREIFCSLTDQVIVVRMTADKPNRISFVATLTREQDATTRGKGSDRLLMEGQAIVRDDRHTGERKVGVRFAAELLTQAEGGRSRIDGANLNVEGATAVTLLFTAATNFRDADPLATCAKYLDAAAQKPETILRYSHIAAHQRLFRQMDFQLAGPVPDLPTGERLQRVQSGAPDPQLEALYFHFGRYLLISSSRPGTMAANLQGIWNDSLAPSWDSKYTININTEMNYWPAEVCNLSELHEPLFDLLDSARAEGRKTAKVLYGARGFVLHHNTDIWGDAVPIDGAGSGIWPMGAAWLSLHLWDHYDFTGDRVFLSKRAYPVMKEAAEFLLDYLTVDASGRLISGPSISPENRYRTAAGVEAKLCMGPYMDTEIAHALFTRVIQSSEILGIDAAFRAKVSAARDKLPGFQVGKHGQLQEWLVDYDEPEPGHRHTSHLFALHPGNQITPRGTPALAKAARITLERRLGAGGGHTGWSRAWIINFYARLEDGELAHQNLVALLAKSTLPNLLDTHPPFQIDGNLGGTAGIAEMLLQSHAGEISFLPALPKAWPQGSVNGLRARGALAVDLQWTGGKATRALLRPDFGGPQTLRPPAGQRIARVSRNGEDLHLATAKDGSTKVKLGAHKEYEIRFR